MSQVILNIVPIASVHFLSLSYPSSDERVRDARVRGRRNGEREVRERAREGRWEEGKEKVMNKEQGWEGSM